MSIRRFTSTGLVTLTVMLGGLACSSAPALALNTHVLSFTLGGGEGPGAAELSSPDGVAINAVTHNVYVADRGNHRMDEFSSAGIFIRAWGWDVDAEAPKPDVQSCTEATGCQVGETGAGPGEFEAPAFVAVDNSPGSAGDVYVGDTGDNVVSKFTEDGTLIDKEQGSLVEWGTKGQLDGSSTSSFGSVAGVAVDGSGTLFVLNTSHKMFEFEADGTFVTEVELPRGTTPSGLAVNSAGDFFKVNADGDNDDGSVEEITGSDSAFAQVTASLDATGFAVDPSTGDLYVDAAGGAIERYAFGGAFDGTGTVIESGATTCTFGAGLAVDPASGNVYVADSSADRIDVFTPAVLPDITSEPASNLQPTSAALSGTVNPDGLQITSCGFEYGTVSSAAYGESEACEQPPTSIGSGPNPVPVNADVSGLQADTTYHFRLAASNAEGTRRGPEVIFTTPGPVIDATWASVGVTATLFAEINPVGSGTTYHFEYGTSTTYGASIPVTSANIGSGGSVIAVSQSINSGLAPETTYHYRVVATNAQGKTNDGPDKTFTTVSVNAPVARTGAVNDLTQATATLTGTVNPEGWSTSDVFEIGTSEAYGTNIYGQVPGDGTQPQSVSLALENLAPVTTYYYRLSATNTNGTSHGASQAFTTPGAAYSLTVPLAPPLIAIPAIRFPTEPGKVSTTVETLTKAQKLAKALKACTSQRSSARAVSSRPKSTPAPRSRRGSAEPECPALAS
jgi:DNA-binding beta-propeller fold protein YncE